LVPFATAAGDPKKISIGKVSKEPPPPKVFINPATIPVTKINPTFNISINISLFFQIFYHSKSISKPLTPSSINVFVKK